MCQAAKTCQKVKKSKRAANATGETMGNGRWWREVAVVDAGATGGGGGADARPHPPNNGKALLGRCDVEWDESALAVGRSGVAKSS